MVPDPAPFCAYYTSVASDYRMRTSVVLKKVRGGRLRELKHLSNGGKEINSEIPVVVASEPGSA